jgi:Uncharacterized protein conserved in bacteria (DUF2252)
VWQVTDAENVLFVPKPGTGEDGQSRSTPSLAATPVSGVTVQVCGDAHLSDFGLFGTPGRQMIFDINDVDETLPGRGSGMSSGWRRASRSWGVTGASPQPAGMPWWGFRTLITDCLILPPVLAAMTARPR